VSTLVTMPLVFLLAACGDSLSSIDAGSAVEPPGSPGAPPVEEPDTSGPPAPIVPSGPLAPRYTSAVVTRGDFAVESLPPLPSPPLTPLPDADDEPRAATGPYDTATDFALVEERAPLPDEPEEGAEEESFPTTPPEPVVQAPPGHDLTANSPPYFPDLDHVTLYAGELLELRLAPVDPDGGVAGQHLERFPLGSQYIDNFDTTRTLRWLPYEQDIGIHEVIAYANDPVEPDLHAVYTIRIRVLMPSDPSTIENLRPGIDRIEPQTVRVGDPVVINVKGTDRNATVPTLELTDAPPGATLVPHRTDPRIRVLRFVPDRTGTLGIGVLARDARDPTLTAEQTILVDVRAAEDFLIDGPSLRELAEARDFLIGYASASNFYRRPDGALYGAVGPREFNLVTAENSMKWDTLNPLPGVYRWSGADNLVAQARAHALLVHGHTLVWYAQLPSWVKESELALREGHMREHIDRVLTRYADDVPIWDVVNEALDDEGGYRESVWLEAMGPAYIDIAFRQARASAPEATLLYNEYDIGYAGPKADGLVRLLERMRAAGTPIDGVGFQMHVSTDYDTFDELAENFRRVAALDLDIWITELDVSMYEDGDTEEMQATVYEGVLDACLAEPRCKGLQSWGFTDRYSWRKPFTPLILDESYRPKPAYLALQRRLGEN